MIVKVKEPQAVEYRRLKPHQILFTYLHLAPDPEQARGLMESGATAIAYETVTDANGGLPLLAPMSEVAGRLAIEAAAIALRRPTGGRGVLHGRRPRRSPGEGRGARRRCRRHACGAHGRWPRRRRLHHRPVAAASASARRAVPRPRAHARLDHASRSRPKFSAPTS